MYIMNFITQLYGCMLAAKVHSYVYNNSGGGNSLYEGADQSIESLAAGGLGSTAPQKL